MEESGIVEDSFTIRRADSRASRERAWSLVHRRYLDKGYAAPGDTPWRATVHDMEAGTRTFFTETGPQANLLATFTLVADGPLGLLMDGGWKASLDELRSQGRRLREATKLAVADTEAGDGIAHLMPLFRVALLESRRCQATDILLTVNPRHRGFYKKVLGFTELAPAQALASVLGAPGVPLRFDLLAAPEFFRGGSTHLYQYFYENANEAKTLEWLARPYRCPDSEELQYFFGQKFEKVTL